VIVSCAYSEGEILPDAAADGATGYFLSDRLNRLQNHDCRLDGMNSRIGSERDFLSEIHKPSNSIRASEPVKPVNDPNPPRGKKH